MSTLTPPTEPRPATPPGPTPPLPPPASPTSDSPWSRLWLLAQILYDEIDRDRMFMQAAALTYKTLFSLLPIFVLTLLILSMISTGSGRSALEVQVRTMLFEQLQLDQLPLTDDTGHPMIDAAGKPIYLANVAERLIDRAKSSITDKAATITGLVALAILLYGALSLMVVIEGTFNQVYGSVRPRSWPRRLMLYWSVLTLGPLGVAASIILGHSAFTTATSLAGTGMLLSAINITTSFCISWLLVLIMYRLIPDTHVHWRSAVIGSFIGALLWEIGKFAFGLYVDRALRTSAYGALAIIPLFMLWIYLTWSVILIGLETSYTHQYWPLLKRRHYFTHRSGGGGGGAGGGGISDARWVLPLGILLYRRFREGRPTRPHDAAELLILPNDVAEQLLEGLASAGVVHRTRVGRGGGDAYALARPPEQITAHDLLAAARSMCAAPPQLRKDRHKTEGEGGAESPSRPLADLEELEARWAKSHTLPALSGEAPLPPPTPQPTK